MLPYLLKETWICFNSGNSFIRKSRTLTV